MPNSDQTNTSGVGKAQDSEDQIPLATFTQYRSLLFSLAYRMLGTVADAEDILQEAFVRWQGAPQDESVLRKPFSLRSLRTCGSTSSILHEHGGKSTWANGCRNRL
jgi:hypothetical protein